ncbi:MAG: Cysteine desulfurase NifS [Rhodocyclaceae bacterium]|nr:Cysteine desulfurase NifS [Rhodocyclaceae bacterium]
MSPMSVYLDHNATTPPAEDCVQAMLHCLRENWGNPSSKHAAGDAARMAVHAARAACAALIGAAPAEIVFTSGATEANHQAILGALAARPGCRHLVTSQVEHPSVLSLCRALEARGVAVSYLPVDGEGRLDAAAVEAALRPDTALVSLMWANNETGVLFPIESIAERVRAAGVLMHCDATQALARVPVDMATVPVDLLSFSGHKLHAVKGVGGLFVRKGVKLPALLHGHQERGRRGGTENVPGIVALGVAARLAADGLSGDVARMAALRTELEGAVRARWPWVRVWGDAAERLPNTSFLGFGDIDGEVMLDALARASIQASSGAACVSGGTEPSHVLLAMGATPAAARASIRLSLSRYTRADEIAHVVESLDGILTSLAGRERLALRA